MFVLIRGKNGNEELETKVLIMGEEGDNHFIGDGGLPQRLTPKPRTTVFMTF